jgi:hypothetical protein
MDIFQTLHPKLSRENINQVVDYVGSDMQRFAQLYEILEGCGKAGAPRVAWAMSICLDHYPELGLAYQQRLVRLLKNPVHTSVARTVLRYFTQISLEEEYQGVIYQYSIDFLINPSVPAAIRVHAMQIMYNIGKQNPELLHELAIILQEILPLSNGGVLNRGIKLLRKIQHITGLTDRYFA